MLSEAFKVFAVFSLVDEVTRPLKHISQGFDAFEKKLKKISESFNEISKRYTELGGKLIAGGAGLALGFAAPVKAAADFQEAMADVNKVADFTAKEYAEFSSKLLKLSEVIPLAVEDLAALAAAGAQMGVAKKDLIYFTETVAKLATAFDMPAGEIGDIMGKLANVFRIPITQIGKLGDAINELSNRVATNAPSIVEVLSRIGGTAASINMTAQEAAALGAALLALGETPERAGTALNDMLNTLANLSVQPKKVRESIEELGINIEELEAGIREKPIPTLLKFLETLKASGEASKYLTLIFGIEPAPKLIKLVNNTEKLKETLHYVAEEATYAGSAQKEFETRAATFNNQLAILRNTFKHIAINMGTVFLPLLTKVAQAISKTLSSIADFAEKHKTLSKVLLGTVGALGIFLVGIGSVFLLIGMFAKGISIAIEGMIEFKKVIIVASRLFGALRLRILSTTTAVWSWIAAQWASVRASIAQAGGLRALSMAYLGRLLTGIRAAIGAVWSFNAALLANPITWVVGAVVALGGALYLLERKFHIISRSLNFLKTLAVSFCEGFIEGFRQILSASGLIKAFSALWQSLKEVFISIRLAFASLINAIAFLLKPILEPFKKILEIFGIIDKSTGKASSAFLNFGKIVGKIVSAPLFFPFKILAWVLNLVAKGIGLVSKGIAFLSQHWESVLKVFLWVNPFIAPIVALNKLVQFVSEINLFEAGKKILLTLVEGIKAVALTPYQAVKSALSKVRNLLPFSPAKEGPLSDLNIAGIRLLTTVAENVRGNELIAKVSSALQGVRKTLNTPFEALSIPVGWMTEKRIIPSKSEKVVPYTINLHLTQNIKISGEGEPEKIKSAAKSTTRDFEEAVYRALMRVLERNRRLTFSGEA